MPNLESLAGGNGGQYSPDQLLDLASFLDLIARRAAAGPDERRSLLAGEDLVDERVQQLTNLAERLPLSFLVSAVARIVTEEAYQRGAQLNTLSEQ